MSIAIQARGLRVEIDGHDISRIVCGIDVQAHVDSVVKTTLLLYGRVEIVDGVVRITTLGPLASTGPLTVESDQGPLHIRAITFETMAS